MPFVSYLTELRSVQGIMIEDKKGIGLKENNCKLNHCYLKFRTLVFLDSIFSRTWNSEFGCECITVIAYQVQMLGLGVLRLFLFLSGLCSEY